MMKVVVYSAKASRVLIRLPPEIRQRIVSKIERYARSGGGDVTSLVGTGLFRLRVGDYRVIFAEDEARIAVGRIGHRSNVY